MSDGAPDPMAQLAAVMLQLAEGQRQQQAQLAELLAAMTARAPVPAAPARSGAPPPSWRPPVHVAAEEAPPELTEKEREALVQADMDWLEELVRGGAKRLEVDRRHAKSLMLRAAHDSMGWMRLMPSPHPFMFFRGIPVYLAPPDDEG